MSNIDKQALRSREEFEEYYNETHAVKVTSQFKRFGYYVSPTMQKAWELWQKAQSSMLDELDKKQQYIKLRDQENEDIALTVGKLRVELEHYKSREERVTKLVLDNSTSWDVLYEKLEAAERRIANNERVMRAVVEAASIRGIRPFEGIECDPPTLEENAEACGDAMSARIRELEANPPKPHHNGLMQISNELIQARQRIAELERSETQLINERDDAESALNDAYKAVMGQAPEWSNWFSFGNAIDEIELVCELWRNQTDDVIQFRQRIAELEKGHQEAAKQINSWRSLAKQNIAERGKDISELEAARQHIAEQSAIVAAAEKLVRCKGRYHSELNYRALAKLFGVVTPDLPPLEHENVHYADAAEVEITALRQRIQELEARAVNLPKRSVDEVMHLSGFSRDYADGWCAGNDNAIHEIRTAGIKVKGE
ncbi:hypothetical protein GPB37_001318 [Salmonella enterica]|nr:hypothetical protein [Salmonella enterica]